MMVDEYYKEMKMLMIRADLKEDGEALMTCFIVGLNSDIAEEVELYHYLESGDLVEMSIKMERQLKARSSRSFSNASNQARAPCRKDVPKRKVCDEGKAKDVIKSKGESSKPKTPLR